jgi:hypothetical protein
VDDERADVHRLRVGLAVGQVGARSGDGGKLTGGPLDPAQVSFVERAQKDLEGTLAAEGISLDPDELAAARSFQKEVAGLSPDEVKERVASASAQQYIV